MNRLLILTGFIFLLGCKDSVPEDIPAPIYFPNLTTLSVTDVSEATASGGGHVTYDGGSFVSERGVCWGTYDYPTLSNNKTIMGNDTGRFTGLITGLVKNTKYYLRAYAINTKGVTYGNQVSFTTVELLYIPKLTTLMASNITENSATSGGHITYGGIYYINNRGICWSTHKTPTMADYTYPDGVDTGRFESQIGGLTEKTTYYVRAYAQNSKGIAYGNEVSFTTPAKPVIALGETYEGGIIFYIDGTGKHGLIAAPKDQGIVKWGCQGFNVVGTSTALGKGDQNTFLIVNQCTTPGIAARLCYDLDLNGKTDWYLPSKDELKLLHENLYLKNKGNLILNNYWSSSQYNAQNAWIQLFNLALNQNYYDKDLINYSVRAIRTF